MKNIKLDVLTEYKLSYSINKVDQFYTKCDQLIYDQKYTEEELQSKVFENSINALIFVMSHCLEIYENLVVMMFDKPEVVDIVIYEHTYVIYDHKKITLSYGAIEVDKDKLFEKWNDTELIKKLYMHIKSL